MENHLKMFHPNCSNYVRNTISASRSLECFVVSSQIVHPFFIPTKLFLEIKSMIHCIDLCVIFIISDIEKKNFLFLFFFFEEPNSYLIANIKFIIDSFDQLHISLSACLYSRVLSFAIRYINVRLRNKLKANHLLAIEEHISLS